MKELIAEVRQAVKNKTYMAAVALALTLPDICGMVENHTLQSFRQNYISWFDNHMPNDDFKCFLPGFEKQEFNGSVCYSLRCAVLHSGSTDVNNAILNVDIDEFRLTRPGDEHYIKGYCYGNRPTSNSSAAPEICAYIGADYLCERLCDAAEEFYDNWPDKNDFDVHSFAEWECNEH